MILVNIHEAKTNLSKLLAKVEAGEEIVIARSGRPIARLVPVVTSSRLRQAGLDKDRIRYSDDFHQPLPSDVTSEFER